MKMGPEVPNCYYRVSVKALITNDKDEILVDNERSTGWDLPGSGLDWGEDPIEGLKREVQKQLGCDATIDPQTVMIVPSSVNSHNQHVLWVVYHADVNPEQVTSTDEVQEARFMSLEEFHAEEEKYDFFEWDSPVDFWSEVKTLIK